MQAQHGGGAALIAVAMLQHFSEQRDLQLAQGRAVQIIGVATILVTQITARRGGDMLAQGCAAGVLAVVVKIQ